MAKKLKSSVRQLFLGIIVPIYVMDYIQKLPQDAVMGMHLRRILVKI